MKKFLLSLFCLLMAFANIQAETVTYTVISTKAVEVIGTAPTGASATYISTYTSKNQLTAGNSMTLTLSGYKGYKITGITMSMKSNKSSGAGSFSMVAGTTSLASIDTSTFDKWHESYTTTYTEVKPANMINDNHIIAENEKVVITITATENSLYCQSFTIVYEKVNTTEPETPSVPEEPEVTNGVTDVLSRDFTGVTGNTYSVWSGKAANSNAVYAGNSAGGNSSIQLRSTDHSGIVTTASGGKVKKVVVEWNSSTTDGRVLDIYGKNSAYSSAADLYGSNKGTKIGSITKGTSTELEITGDYEYIGLRSNSGAMYLSSISITWDASNVVEAVAQPVISPEATEFNDGDNVTVTITTETEGATIHYTLDGSDPTTDSYEYNEVITISATTTVKAIAVKKGLQNSAIATKTFTRVITLENATVADVIAAHKAGDKVAKATVIGYIVGSDKVLSSTTDVNSNIIIADNADENDISNCIHVELKKDTDIRTALNLAENPGNYKKRVILTGNKVEGYLDGTGLKSTSAYGFIVEPKVDAEWATYYAPIDIAIPEGMEAYIATGVNNGSVTLKQIAGTIPANTGVLLKQSGNASTSATTDDVSENLLQGSATNIYVTKEAYVLSMIDGVIGFYKAAMNQQDGTAWLNNANKAYLPASAISEASGISFYGFRFDDEETTGVENVEFRNEKEECFDLAGRRISEITAPGIYIIGGRKVLVK